MDMPKATVMASGHAGINEALVGALCSLDLEEEGGTGEGKEVAAAREEEGNPRRARTPRGVE